MNSLVYGRGPDSTVTMYIPEMDPGSFSWTNATRKSVQDDGFPNLKAEDTYLIKRLDTYGDRAVRRR